MAVFNLLMSRTPKVVLFVFAPLEYFLHEDLKKRSLLWQNTYFYQFLFIYAKALEYYLAPPRGASSPDWIGILCIKKFGIKHEKKTVLLTHY